MVIVETRIFTLRIEELLARDEYHALQLELLQTPNLGDVIPGTGGLRKARVALRGRGKRGGARVIYFWHARTARMLMLYAYSKNEREDLTHAQREALRKIVETEYP